MSFKLKGFDKVQKELKKLEKRARELERTESVPLSDLFTPEFMKKYTDFSSFEELLNAGGFEVNSQEDFQNIPDDIFDEHIAKHTRFNSWQEMLDAADKDYVAHQLGL